MNKNDSLCVLITKLKSYHSFFIGLTIITHSSLILSKFQFNSSPSFKSNWFSIAAGNVVLKLSFKSVLNIKVGDQVLVAFIEDDFKNPIVVGIMPEKK